MVVEVVVGGVSNSAMKHSRPQQYELNTSSMHTDEDRNKGEVGQLLRVFEFS